MSRVEVVVIGDEILDGTVTDTNSAWLGRRAAELGARIRWRQVVPDTIDAIVQAFRLAASRAELVLVSGGLGPTEDDLTAQAAAAFLGVPVELNGEALQQIEKWRQRSDRAMRKLDEKQARLPASARPLWNPVGTAPAFEFESSGATFVALPGVPRELRELVERYVVPRLEALVDHVPQSRTWKFFGVTESELATRVDALDTDDLEIHYRAHFPEIHLTVVAADAEGIERFEPALMDVAGRQYFGGKDAELAAVVNAGLRERGWTVATAESCTGGWLSHLITSVPGASDVFEQGVIAYADRVKTDVLGVPQALLEEHGAVSRPVVEAMAASVRALSGADIGIATSGIAGPGGGTPQKPVGTIHVAASHAGGVKHRRLHFPFERERNRLLTAYVGLALIRNITRDSS